MIGASDTDFLNAYIECALWSSNDGSDDQGGDPLDRNYTRDDLAPETLEAMKADCLAFVDQADELICPQYARAGHDFWLTRNRHGAGFWDGDWPLGGDKLTKISKGFGDGDWPLDGDKLTKISKGFGEVNLYIGDDVKIHQSQG